jgi:hypothetical protein
MDIPEFPLCFWFSWSVGAWLAAERRSFWLDRVPPWLFISAAVACHFIKPLSFLQFLLVSLATASYLSHADNNLPLTRPSFIKLRKWIIRAWLIT